MLVCVLLLFCQSFMERVFTGCGLHSSIHTVSALVICLVFLLHSFTEVLGFTLPNVSAVL